MRKTIDIKFLFRDYFPTTTGEGEHGAATARLKLESGGGSQFSAVGSNRTLTGK